MLLLFSFKPFYPATTTGTQFNIPTAVNPVDPTRIPLGDGNLSTGPKVGSVYSCQTSFSGGGAQAEGPWIDSAAKTWNSTAKIAVEGSVSWPDASYTVQVSGNKRVVTTNDLPENHTSGTFPVAKSDPAFQYDHNPNHIATQPLALTLPATPSLANEISCVPLGPIGVLNDGVVLFNALDDEGRDAAAHEILDSCGGHPDGANMYHHHDIPPCILSKTTGASTSTLVGYAIDGFGIYVERDANGNILTNDNLDACHGRTSEVMWDGTLTKIYHYDATLEYPYTVGCFGGTPIPTPFTGRITSTVPVTTTSTSTTVTSSSTSTSTTARTSTSVASTTSSSSTTVSTSAPSSGYTVSISEAGLPASSRWGVTLDGSTQMTAAGSAVSLPAVSPGNHTVAVVSTGAAVFVGWSNVEGQISLQRRGPSSARAAAPQPHSFVLQVNGPGSLIFDFAQPAGNPVSSVFSIVNGRGNATLAISKNVTVSLNISNAPASFNGASANATAADLGTAPPAGSGAPLFQGAARFFDVSVSVSQAGQGTSSQSQQGSPPIVPVCFAGPGIAGAGKLFFWNFSSWQSPPGQTAQASGSCLGVPLDFLTGTLFALVTPPAAPSTSSLTTTAGPITSFSTSSTVNPSTSSATTSSGGVPEFPPQLVIVAVLTLAIVSGYITMRRRSKAPVGAD